VSTTGDGTRKQGDVDISNFPISLGNGFVIDVIFVCEFMGSSRALGGWKITVCVTLMTSYRLVPMSRTRITRRSMVSHKTFAPAIAGMSSQIHVDLLLLRVLADKQMRSYYQCMGKEDKIRNEVFQWARAKDFNPKLNKTIGRAIAFGCATRCHLSVHSLALPRSGSGDDSRGGGTGTGAPGGGSRGGRRRTSGAANISTGGGGACS